MLGRKLRQQQCFHSCVDPVCRHVSIYSIMETGKGKPLFISLNKPWQHKLVVKAFKHSFTAITEILHNKRTKKGRREDKRLTGDMKQDWCINNMIETQTIPLLFHHNITEILNLNQFINSHLRGLLHEATANISSLLSLDSIECY